MIEGVDLVGVTGEGYLTEHVDDCNSMMEKLGLSFCLGWAGEASEEGSG